MTSRWVCAYCVMSKGLRGSDLSNWPTMDDVDAQIEHVESEHHVPVRREGETSDQALIRFKATYPEAGGPNCKCPTCTNARQLGQKPMHQ